MFSDRFPINLYVNAAKLLVRVRTILRTRAEMTHRDRANLRFYVLYWLVASVTNSMEPRPEDVANLQLDRITYDDIAAAIDAVWTLFVSLGKDDQVAKGSELINSLQNALKSQHE